jgi:hypothetical protein
MPAVVRLNRALTAPPARYMPHRNSKVSFYLWNAVGAASKEKHHAILKRLWEYLRHDCAKPEPIFPPTKDEVLAFVADKGDKVKAQTIMNWISSLKSGLADIGADVSYFDSRDVVLFKRGVRRVKGETTVKTALPLTLPILLRVNARLLEAWPSRREVVLATAFALAFACFLRSGEFTYDVFDPELDLQRQDIIEQGETLMLRLKTSKTDQTRMGRFLPVPRLAGAEYAHVCPTTLLRRLLTDYPDLPEAPLFSFSALKHSYNFDKKTVITDMRHVLDRSGCPMTIDGRTYTGHSFRRGAATWAARVGLTDSEIRHLGRWSLGSSQGSCPRYIELRSCDIAAAAQRMYRIPVASGASLVIDDDLGSEPWNSDGDDHDKRRTRP